MSIDKVELYPFSPLKLLHETRKLTAAQAKFFVALMCLYFEKQGYLEYSHINREFSNEAKARNAAIYAPYCGVTKKTFMKLIDALFEARVIHFCEGNINPVIAEEIMEAFIEKQTHRIVTVDEGFTDVPVACVKEEGVAAGAADMFCEESEARDGAQADAGTSDKRHNTLTVSAERAAEIKRVNAEALAYARKLGKDDDFFKDEKKYSESPSVRREKFLEALEEKRCEVSRELITGRPDLLHSEIFAQVAEEVSAFAGINCKYDFALWDIKLQKRDEAYAARDEADLEWEKLSKKKGKSKVAHMST